MNILGFDIPNRKTKLSTYILGFTLCLCWSILWNNFTEKQKLSVIIHDRAGTTTTTRRTTTEEATKKTTDLTTINHNKSQGHVNYHKNKSGTALAPNISYPFTFAACLQTKDDNLILPEWLAYHYTVLPLRHLIVAIDPLSITTPEPIFEKFRSIGMKIDVWTGNSYFMDGRWYGTKMENFDPKNHTAEHAFNMHNQRQISFYTNCLRELKQNHSNTSWVVVVDSDEYITYNTFLPMEEHAKKLANQSKHSFRMNLPRTIGKQNETIAHYIANQWKIDGAESVLMRNDSLCTVFPRINFIAKDVREEGNNNSYNNKDDATMFRNNLVRNSTSTSCILPPTAQRPKLPKGFDLAQFHTLRFPFHTMHAKLLPGKSLINVKTYNGREKTQNPHRPFRHYCDNEIWPDMQDERISNTYPFRVHHYSGSLETFLSRPERTEEMWYWKNRFVDNDEQQSHYYDDSLMDWFSEFVKLVGRDKAFELTQQIHEQTHEEYLEMKRKYNHKLPPPVFDWD